MLFVITRPVTGVAMMICPSLYGFAPTKVLFTISRLAGTITANLLIVNNTFVGANPYKDGQIIIATPVTGLVITNNIFYQPTTAGIWFDAPGLTGTVANNLTYGASLST